ncbi:hypothetical protein NDU88_004243 [Pleurodeles waltl]|uniref:Reverse transcriptase n=1 Tax=Pleurodeles waltl TaxID=8319 RepID=A0AAV7PKG0_PLEWA|nr:hypothetical protein NDU88_004243 [Pleurodeles waltl]
MGIPEIAMSRFRSTKKAEAFTDLLLNNGLRFVNGRSKSDGAAKATFNNGKSTLIIDYVIINMEAWSSILDIAVVNRVESDHNPLVLVMRADALGLGITTGRALGLHMSEIVLSNCRRTIRWDGEKYRQGLRQLEPIIACHRQSIIDAPTKYSPLILAVYDQMTKKLGALCWVPISKLAVLGPILYWVRLVRKPRAVVYQETLEEATACGGLGGRTWGTHVKGTLANLRFEALWEDLGAIGKDTAGTGADSRQGTNDMLFLFSLQRSQIPPAWHCK